MRILLDLQSCQTESSRNRGVGRYSISLAEAMIRQGEGHEFFVILNGAFTGAARAVRTRLEAILPPDRIKTFDIVTPCFQLTADNSWRYSVSKVLRDEFIATLQPDAVHMTSLFEGLGENAVTEILSPRDGLIQAVTVYDLIPYIHAVPYLQSQVFKDWYYRKLQSLKRADLLLAISASSREEVIDYLHVPGEAVVNISSAISDVFRQIELTTSEREELLVRHGLTGRYIMYTGGIDYRKNIEGLIEAYAMLPTELREGRQLAIVCSVREEQRKRLLDLAREVGLHDNEVVLTGYVTENDLIALYNTCELFVFPSLHEGFGLPVLEAMACGAPTIGGNNSSIPEVVGLKEALFDATNPAAIATKMRQVLEDTTFAATLKAHGLRQVRHFSWDTSARAALKAIEAAHARSRASLPALPQGTDTPLRLALVSPFPPLRTGIATHCASLLPELCRYYDVEIVTDQETIDAPWATANCDIVSVDEFIRRDTAGLYDRIVYHVGNSEFHAHMPDLLANHPGVVVLHDYFLSGMQNWQAKSNGKSLFIDALLDTHGYPALIHFLSDGIMAAIGRYPANASIAENAAGMIVHSRSSVERLGKDFGLVGDVAVRHIPLLRERASITRSQARKTLGLADDDLLISSFGIIAPTKENHLLVEAFELAGLVGLPHVRLVLVGWAPGEYGERLTRRIRRLGPEANVSITGYADEDTYALYLAASDLAVQLRSGSRGETSAAVLEVLAYGVPLIVNAHGTMAELDKTSVVMLPDEVKSDDLAHALRELIDVPERREALSVRALRMIREKHAPSIVGRLYRDAIETFSALHPLARHGRLVRRIAREPATAHVERADLATFAAVATGNQPRPGPSRMFVDISLAIGGTGDPDRQRWVLGLLDAMIAEKTPWRIEPVYMIEGEEVFRAARSFMAQRIGWSDGGLEDRVVAPRQGDIFLGLDSSAHSAGSGAHGGLFAQWRARGVVLRFVASGSDTQLLATSEATALRGERFEWLDGIAGAADQIIATTAAVAGDLAATLDLRGPAGSDPLPIFSLDADGADGMMRAAIAPVGDPRLWHPQPGLCFGGGDPRMSTQVGERRGRVITSIGTAGFLVYGPYTTLPPGTYACWIWGNVGDADVGETWIDVAAGSPQTILIRTMLRDARGETPIPGLIASLVFTSAESCTDLEVRLWVAASAEIVFHRLDLRSIEAANTPIVAVTSNA